MRPHSDTGLDGARSLAAGVFAVAGLTASGLYFVLPSGGVAQGLVFVGLNVVAVGLLVSRVIRTPLHGPMRVLAGAQVIYTSALGVWYLYPVGWNGVLPYPSVVDGLFFVAYGGWATFLVVLMRRRASSDPTMFLDGAAAGIGLAILAWPLVLKPAVDGSGVSGLDAVVSVAYVLMMLVLASLGVRFALSATQFSTIDRLLVAWLVCELAADTWFSVASIEGSFRYGHPWFGAWLGSYVALGTLALQPRLEELVAPATDRARPQFRTGMLGAIGVLAIGAIASQAAVDVRTETYIMAGAGAVALAMVLYRLQVTTSDLVAERELRTEIQRLADELAHAATHDELTGAVNRAAFNAFLPRALARRRAPGHVACVLLVDVDSFKAVNDHYGHWVGDQLLREIVGRLAALARPSDLVARLGGDEFAVVVDDGAVRTALVLAERVVAALTEPFAEGGAVIVPSVSVGVYAASSQDSASEALQCVNAAMYAAKKGGGGFELYDPERHRHFIDRFRLEVELRSASSGDELAVHYQPVVELATRAVVKSEALVRWNHPVRGLLNPGVFIEVAEESGAIVDVGRWVLQRACIDAARWQQRSRGDGVGVTVNVSRRQLRSPTIVDDVRGALDVSGIAAELLTIEVTETALMDDTDEMVALLDKIKALGVGLAMDDFGTGYSSLAHLRALPVDLLKIDKAFVDGIAREDEEWALAAAIIRLAGSLGKRTLAEGIERASQLAHLRTLGCELGQGWLFARAMPFDEFVSFLADHHRTESR